ncbi:MAG: matrixin family metalloprotease [Rhodospirillaceae bacterium]
MKLDGYQVKWGKHGLGTGVTVQYAFIKTAMNFPDARNCRGLVPIDGLVAEAKVDATVFRAEVRAAFAMWESVADIHFQPTNDPSQAQILIGAEATPEGWAFTDVAYQHAGTSKVRTIERSLICLNPTRPWKVGFGGRSDAYDLRYVFTHEIGHAIGLDHPGPSGQVMSFCYGERFHELQNGDIAGVVALYGERPLSSETFTQSISISQPVSATE